MMDPRAPAAATGRRLVFLCIATLALLLAGGITTARAQKVRSAITPDSILVGDVFRAAIRIELPPSYTLVAPDTLPVHQTIENAGRRRLDTRELPDGGTEVTIIYPLTAWRTGEHPLPSIDLTLNGPDGVRVETVNLPVAYIESVLPVDTAGLTPRPPKDVIGASRLIWPWIVAALTIALGIVAFVYYQRRRRPSSPALTFDVAHADSPRERALAALDRLRAQGLVEEGRFKEFYSGTTAALREFLEEYNADWGTELTTAELIVACGPALNDDPATVLARLLSAADQVKFNRGQPTAEAALADWEAARHWVKTFQLRSPAAPEDAPVPRPTDSETDTEVGSDRAPQDSAGQEGREEAP